VDTAWEDEAYFLDNVRGYLANVFLLLVVEAGELARYPAQNEMAVVDMKDAYFGPSFRSLMWFSTLMLDPQ
jgi:hypothetical protein